ncbi:hypothetical protein [Flavihumibacter petaseus]|uniref:Lipoprotein n=1 Tax=Flavihumibacter petaseus NBRC 106054 TaxID=1220578 RepID=A0A0E9N083_9BACT|nr:hypothetical protein [Flavihumibacter petaseus]GAO43402.1 hypothetical protein FPE01S_02_05070 [Flavihumibacter petaseus NBRC 106054]
MKINYLLAMAGTSLALACGGPDKAPDGSGTINNDSTSKTDTGYMTPEDSARNAKYSQPNSDNPPKPLEQH